MEPAMRYNWYDVQLADRRLVTVEAENAIQLLTVLAWYDLPDPISYRERPVGRADELHYHCPRPGDTRPKPVRQ